MGSTSGQIGDFLNQLSGLLVLWVGMWLVLQGELTLGMLWYRIISGNVTGPLSTFWLISRLSNGSSLYGKIV